MVHSGERRLGAANSSQSSVWPFFRRLLSFCRTHKWLFAGLFAIIVWMFTELVAPVIVDVVKPMFVANSPSLLEGNKDEGSGHRVAPTPHLTWAVASRTLNPTELRLLKLMRATPANLFVVKMYLRNDSQESVHQVTVYVRFDAPLVAHSIPVHGLLVTDGLGRTIRDSYLTFAHKKEAAFTLHGFPVAAHGYAGSIVTDGTNYEINCLVAGKPIPPSAWPEEADLRGDVILGQVTEHQ